MEINSLINTNKTLLFINYEISLTKSTFIPNYIPKFESRMDVNAHKVFWKQIKIKRRKCIESAQKMLRENTLKNERVVLRECKINA